MGLGGQLERSPSSKYCTAATKGSPQWMVRMTTLKLLPFCQMQYFHINQPKVFVVREGYHVVTNVNLRVNRMVVRMERNKGNLIEGETLIISVPSVKETRT